MRFLARGGQYPEDLTGAQTVEEARKAHAARYPEDDLEKMMVIRCPPMTAAEWEAEY